MKGEEQGNREQRLRKAFHKFNNLLVTIMGSATLGKRQAEPDSDAHRHFANVEDASRQAAGLLHEIRGLIGLDEREEFESLVPRKAREAEDPVEDLVLVVDDDATIRDLLVRMLETMGRRVVAAADGEAALEAARGHPSSPTLALVDLTMPGMSGEQVFLELRKLLPDLRIIMMSGYGENASLSFLEGGAREFLQKPFSLADLREAIGNPTA